MNNYDKIRNMTKLEFAIFLFEEIENENVCKFCIRYKQKCPANCNCTKNIEKWLGKEAK